MQEATLGITHSPHPPGNAAREGLSFPISQIRSLRFREAELPRVCWGALFTGLLAGSSPGLSLSGSPSRISPGWNVPEATKFVLSTWPSTGEQACWGATCSGWGGGSPERWARSVASAPRRAVQEGSVRGGLRWGPHPALCLGAFPPSAGGVLLQGRDAPTSRVGGGLQGEGGSPNVYMGGR